MALPWDKAFAFRIDGQHYDYPFYMSFVASRLNGPRRQDPLQAVRRLYAHAKLFRWDFAIANQASRNYWMIKPD
jgi:hypothetical protein